MRRTAPRGGAGTKKILQRSKIVFSLFRERFSCDGVAVNGIFGKHSIEPGRLYQKLQTAMKSDNPLQSYKVANFSKNSIFWKISKNFPSFTLYLHGKKIFFREEWKKKKRFADSETRVNFMRPTPPPGGVRPGTPKNFPSLKIVFSVFR